MKTKRMIDEQRILNIITAAKFVCYAPIDRLTDNKHLSSGAMTDKIRVSALNYLIDNIRDEVGLNFGDVANNTLSGLEGETDRFTKEAMIMGWNFAKFMSAMEDKNDNKKVKEIAYGDQTAVELDINGKWQKGYGTIVVIEGYKFIFVPRKYSNGINIEVYSLDSLKLFDSKPMSFITAWLQCATKEGFMEATAPLAIRISEQLNKMKSLNGWKEIFQGEYLSAIAECGARSEKERRLLKEFDSKGA